MYEPEPEPEIEPEPEPTEDQGTTAIALYDYDAAEDNELSFKEGDLIVGIESVSEEWWSGFTLQTREEGREAGLFPGELCFGFSLCYVMWC